MTKIIRLWLLACSLAAASAVAAPGQADRTLGSDGKLALGAVGTPWFNFFESGDGKLVLTHTSTSALDVTRRLADGSRDMAWGNAGNVIVMEKIRVDAVAFQADGKLLLAGTGIGRGLTFMRMLPNGATDTTFGANGFAVTPDLDAYESRGGSAVVMPDGRIVVATFAATGELFGINSGRVAAMRLNADGSLDATYGVGGVVKQAFGYLWGPTPEFGRQLRVSPEGVVDLVRVTPKGLLSWSRLAADGRPDARWGVDGTLTLQLPMNAEQLVLTPDGGLLAIDALDDQVLNVLTEARVMRLKSDGSIDTAFGTGGLARLDTGGAYFFRTAPLPDGGYALVGRLDERSLAIRRLTARGLPDARFGTNGVVRTEVPWPEAILSGESWISAQGYLNLVTETTPYSSTSEVALRRIQLVGDLVEFRNGALNHYFYTYDGDEAQGIDAGAAGAGWSRTGGSFRPGGTTPVCRFYGTPGIGPNSHFFTASKEECEIVKQSRGWTYEGPGFHTTPPSSGQCAAGLQPVHRLYNNRASQNDSNHRFVTDTALVPPMQAQGWAYEGIVFCAKP